MAMDAEVDLQHQANEYSMNLHNNQAEKEQKELNEYAAIAQSNELASEQIGKSNAELGKQVNLLGKKMIELRAKIAQRQTAKRLIKKQCDHANVIDKLETSLQSRENEFGHARDELVKALKAKEKLLQQHTAAIKSIKAEIELIRRQRQNTDATVLGVDRMN